MWWYLQLHKGLATQSYVPMVKVWCTVKLETTLLYSALKEWMILTGVNQVPPMESQLLWLSHFGLLGNSKNCLEFSFHVSTIFMTEMKTIQMRPLIVENCIILSVTSMCPHSRTAGIVGICDLITEAVGGHRRGSAPPWLKVGEFRPLLAPSYTTRALT